MNKDKRRILRNTLLLSVATVGVFGAHYEYAAKFPKFDYLSGWALLLAFLFF